MPSVDSPLSFRTFGNSGHIPIVLLHGFTQTAHIWGSFADMLGIDRPIIAIDLPGHGGSGSSQATLREGSVLLKEAIGKGIEDLGIDDSRFDLVGYSLGARFGLGLGILPSFGLRRMVLISARPSIKNMDARIKRQLGDNALAKELEDKEDVADFITTWVRKPLFSGLRTYDIEARSQNTPIGLATSLRLAGAGSQDFTDEEMGLISVPSLFLAGARDHRFCAFASDLASLVKDGIYSIVPGAGHSVQSEEPELCASYIRYFLG